MSKNLKAAIALTFAYYTRQTLTDGIIAIYVGDLSDLDPAACIEAYARWRRNPANKRFPLPAEIREMVNPEQFVTPEVKARETAARICAAVPKCGWNNPAAARLFIGPVGWDVVQRQGGWEYICEHMGSEINPSTFQAQVRDQLEGTFRYGYDTVEAAIKLPDRRRGELVLIGEILASLPPPPDEGA